MQKLEKWQCHDCEKGWLMIDEDTEYVEVKCPFCGTTGSHVEHVAGEADDRNYHEEMGCLWPGYNEFDKAGWKFRNKF